MSGGCCPEAPSADQLHQLLDCFALPPADVMYTLRRFKRLQADIDQHYLTDHIRAQIRGYRHAVAATRDEWCIGLFDFQMGLIYLTCREYNEAVRAFKQAGRAWSLAPDYWKGRSLACLAAFAEGVAQHCRCEFETAVSLYGAAGRAVSDVRQFFDSLKRRPGSDDYQNFVQRLSEYIKEVREKILYDLAIGHNLTGIKPIISPDL